MGRRILVCALVLGALPAACSRGSSLVSNTPAGSVPPIPADALPGRAAAPVQLDLSALSADAADVTGLRASLEDSGFVAGTQRLFSRVQHGRRRLLARVLVFGSPSGADAYLAWLAGHVGDVIGDATPRDDLGIRGGLVYEHRPNPCCHNETRVFLAAWKDGATVLTLEVGGEGARAPDVTELAQRLDAAA